MTTTRDHIAPADDEAALAYEAPQLLARLVDAGAVDSEESAALVFGELKRYMVLSRTCEQPLPMFSAVVDAAWHQFVLFTTQYQDYCLRYLGSFLHHVPAGAAGDESQPEPPEGSWASFVALYEQRFGALPWVWEDAEFVRSASRIKHSRRFQHGTRVEEDASRAHLVMDDAQRARLCSVEPRARPALEFISHHREFLVRELPGLRNGAERLSLVRPLVRHHILQLAI
jgi:hypothetical protein